MSNKIEQLKEVVNKMYDKSLEIEALRTESKPIVNEITEEEFNEVLAEDEDFKNKVESITKFAKSLVF